MVREKTQIKRIENATRRRVKEIEDENGEGKDTDEKD